MDQFGWGYTKENLSQLPVTGIKDAEVSRGSLLKLTISNPDAERELGHDDFLLREALIKTLARTRELEFDGYFPARRGR